MTDASTTHQIGPIGLIGLGNMGAPMANNLAKRGFEVIGVDRNSDVANRAAEAQALISTAPDLKTLADKCRVVILMLPDSNVVGEVMRGAAGDDLTSGGLAKMLAPGAIVIDMSSSFAPETVKLGAQLAALDIHMIDAPVSGGVRRAITGELAIITGGDDGTIDKVASVLEAMGKIYRTGQLGSGHATKALNNYLSAATTIATAEAIVIGQKFGLDAKRMNAVFNNSTGRSNTTDVKVEQYFIPERYTSGFTLGLLDKDVGMARQLSEGLGLDMTMLDQVSAMLRDGKQSLADGADHTAMHAYVKAKADRAG